VERFFKNSKGIKTKKRPQQAISKSSDMTMRVWICRNLYAARCRI